MRVKDATLTLTPEWKFKMAENWIHLKICCLTPHGFSEQEVLAPFILAGETSSERMVPTQSHK